MGAKKENRKTKRPCAAVKELVTLTAELEVVYRGQPRVETFRNVLKWTGCTRKKDCGKKCNYFYPKDEVDFHAGDDRTF